MLCIVADATVVPADYPVKLERSERTLTWLVRQASKLFQYVGQQLFHRSQLYAHGTMSPCMSDNAATW